MHVTPGRSLLQLADYGAPYSGTFIGSLRVLARTCERELGLRTVFGFSRCVADRAWPEELRRDGFGVHFLDRDAPLRARSAAIAELADRENAVVVHSHFGAYDVPAWVAARRGGHRYSVVWHRHNGFPARRSIASKLKDALKLRGLGRSAWLISVSQALHEEALREGASYRRAFCVENGVDTARAARMSAPREALRARFGIAQSARVVLLFGWDPLRKGVDLAIEAVDELSRRSPVLLLLVGGDQLQDFLRARWKELPASVRTVETRECVGDLFGLADVFLSASRDEGFSYALGEAMAHGLPSVVSDIPGASWAATAGALAFANGDAGALARRLDEMLSLSDDARDERVTRGRAYVTTNLSLDAWARRVADVYRLATTERRISRSQTGWPSLKEHRSGAEAGEAANVHAA